MRIQSQAVIAFVPVLHKGYLDFFKANQGDIFIFSSELISKNVHLTRDVRTIEPEVLVEALKVLLPKRTIQALNSKDLNSLNYKSVIMPDDEVCHELAEKYFKNVKVKYIPTFLRWNKIITFKEFEISPDWKITKSVFHKKMIDKAFVEAQKSADWWRQIGALVLKNKKVIYSSHNHHLPTDLDLAMNGDPRGNFNAGEHQDIYTSIHAEAEIIAKAAKDGKSLKGTALYSTTFPCPNCARLIGTAGVKIVYYSKGYSLLDAEKILDHFGVEVVLVA